MIKILPGPITEISLNRPQVMNALNRKLLEELKTVIEKLEQDTSVIAVLLTAEGTRAFCTGADLKERSELSVEQVKSVRALLVSCFNKIANFPKPIIAAVNGMALGGGFELSMCCDFILASDKAVFGLPEVGLAIIPGGGGTVFLPRIISPNKAKELIYTGKRITAPEAYELGIVNHVFTVEEFSQKCREIMNEIANKGPVALQQAKRSVNYGTALDINTAFVLEAESYNTCLYSEDRNEGLKAFIEKRKPKYVGY